MTTETTKYTNASAAGAEVHARAERHMSAKGGTYREAIRAVLAADKQLAEAYAQPAEQVTTTPAVPVPAPVRAEPGKEAGAEVHRRTTVLMESNARLTYQSAVNLVLAADPALKAAYARS